MNDSDHAEWHTDWGRLVAYGAFVFGAAALLWLVVGLVDAAHTRETAGMHNIARRLRILAMGDAGVVLAGAALPMLLLKNSLSRVAVMAVIMWVVLVPSVIYTAQLTLLPY